MSIQPLISREQSVKALVSAIRQIPTGPGAWSARAAMEDFVQKILCGLVEVQQVIQSMDVSDLVVSYAPLAFNFKPIDYREVAHPWETEMQNAYFNAVIAHDPYEDILCNVFQELKLGGKSNRLSQHLTPPTMCRVMNKFMDPQLLKERSNKDELFAVHDLCCGTGSLLLSAISDQFEKGGANALKQLNVSANDLDPLCAAMTALQLVASMMHFELPLGRLSITVGNAITRDFKSALIGAWVGDIASIRRGARGEDDLKDVPDLKQSGVAA